VHHTIVVGVNTRGVNPAVTVGVRVHHVDVTVTVGVDVRGVQLAVVVLVDIEPVHHVVPVNVHTDHVGLAVVVRVDDRRLATVGVLHHGDVVVDAVTVDVNVVEAARVVGRLVDRGVAHVTHWTGVLLLLSLPGPI